MTQFKDPAIKLFGKTIPLPTEEEILVSDASATCKATITSASASLHDDRLSDYETSPPATSFKEKSSKQDDKKHSGEHTKDQDENGTSHQDSDAKETPKNGERNETSILQENTTKKPDKILACPRCNSMDTKFCYYNNYNVNQPRHFCKNCQRYWTAGGTMRNVPVGAGRRKNKHSSASHYRHIMVSEALQSARTNAAAAELTTPVTTASYSIDKGCRAGSQEPLIKNFQGVHPQVQCFPAPPWSYPWNSAMPPPAFYPPGFPVSFCSAPNFHSVSGSWPSNLWFSLPPTSPNHSSRFNSPTLGKHSREEEEVLRENDEERGIWIPKSLRIDDPSEAAKSSIWATLGIKNHEKTSSINGGGFFKAFQSKAEEKNHIADTSPVLQANPAALSRSLNFHENS